MRKIQMGAKYPTNPGAHERRWTSLW